MTAEATPINLFATNTRDVWFGLNGHLGIVLNPNGVSFYLFNESTSEIVGHIDLALPHLLKGSFIELSQALASLPLLKNKFKKVSLVVNSLANTVVPISLYDVTKKKELFMFNMPLQENEIILTDRLISQEAVLLYSIKKELHDYLVVFFPNISFKHINEILIDFAPNTLAVDKIIFSTNDDLLSIVVLKNNKLVFSNSFNVQTNEDVAYYVFFTMEQLELSHKSSQLLAVGDISADLENLITPYVQYFSKIDSTYNLKNTQTILGDKLHEHFIGLTLTQCE